MELVAGKGRTAGAERAVGAQAQAPIAEMQLARGEAGHGGQQVGHGIALAGAVDQPGAKNHITATLAEHGVPVARVGAQAVEKAMIAAEAAGVQFRVAARQEYGIGMARRGLVRQR